jgi:hypothetical protein
MAFHHSPRIITDGLVLSLDAGDKNSYPGSGTAWTDLSGNGNNGTLQGSPSTITYNNVDVLHLEKDSSQYVSLDSNPIAGLSDVSAEFWIRFESVQGSAAAPYYQLIIFETCMWIAHYAGHIGIDLSDGSWFDGNGGVITGAQVDDNGSAITTGKWYNPCFAWGDTSVDCYMNGVKQATAATTGVSTLGSGTTPRELGRRGGSTTQFDGDYAIARLYNRKLSATEISQNFNAQRHRFGV